MLNYMGIQAPIPMKNKAESMPKPAEERKSIPAQDEDLAALTRAIDKVDAEKRAKELEMRSALADLDATLEKVLLQSEFDTAFEGIKDAEALAVEKEVDDIFNGLQSKEMPAAQAPEAEKPKVEYDLMRLGDAKLRKGLLEMLQSRKIDVVLENYRHDVAQAELFDVPFNSVLEAAGVPEAGDTEKAA